MKTAVLKSAARPPDETGERCSIRELLNDPASLGASLAETRVDPGVITQLHALDVDERYVITSGCGRVELDGAWTEVAAGDAVLIPAGCAQRIENPGPETLDFFCLCTPRFTAAAYRSLEP